MPNQSLDMALLPYLGHGRRNRSEHWHPALCVGRHRPRDAAAGSRPRQQYFRRPAIFRREDKPMVPRELFQRHVGHRCLPGHVGAAAWRTGWQSALAQAQHAQRQEAWALRMATWMDRHRKDRRRLLPQLDGRHMDIGFRREQPAGQRCRGGFATGHCVLPCRAAES